MSGQLIPFNQAGGLPAHIAAAFGDDESNTQGRASIDQLSYRGKIWRAVIKGEEHILQKTDPETGELIPLSVVSLVVLDLNKARSRSYYEGAFEDGKNQAPKCYSADGVTPDASVKEKQSATCATCQWSVKGSRVTESGKASTACSPFKRIAVVPSTRIADHPPMLLRLAQTSVWDKDADGKDGWYAWDQYVDMLRARGAKHSALVETRVKFDINVPYPKLLFSASRWLNEAEIAQAKARIASEKDAIELILNGGGSDGVAGQPGVAPAGHDPVPAAQAPAAAPAQAAAPAAAPAQAAAPAAPKAPPKPKAPPAAEPQFEVKITKTIDLAKTEGFTLEQMLEAGWDEEQLVAEGMLVITEEKIPVAAPAAPKAPPKPRGPKKPPAAQAAAPAAAAPAAAPAVEKVAAEAVDDGFGGAQASAPAAAAAATPVAETTVVEGTPKALSALLDDWDA